MSQPKSRTVAILLALIGIVVPGLHKFYLGQTTWGVLYLLPGMIWAMFPIGELIRLASLFDGLIYLFQGEDRFNHRFNPAFVANSPLPPSRLSQMLALIQPFPGHGLKLWFQPQGADPARVEAIAQALRQLDQLRQEGLITEYEFEQQRRQLLQ